LGSKPPGQRSIHDLLRESRMLTHSQVVPTLLRGRLAKPGFLASLRHQFARTMWILSGVEKRRIDFSLPVAEGSCLGQGMSGLETRAARNLLTVETTNKLDRI